MEIMKIILCNYRPALDAGSAISLHIWHYWSGASERGRSAMLRDVAMT
jgi:hypothetical protein